MAIGLIVIALYGVRHSFRDFSTTILVFAVKPAKVLAFAKGAFAQTRHIFS